MAYCCSVKRRATFVRPMLSSCSIFVRRPSRGRLAAPSALPGLAPAQPAASRCLHSFTIPDGPAAIRSCSAPPLAASLRLALESLIRSADWDVASTSALQQSCVFLTQNRFKSRRTATFVNADSNLSRFMLNLAFAQFIDQTMCFRFCCHRRR